ncbi:MAG: MFS transporter [Phenylobacterium sp.]|uniref:MFS transporter n=1 Tax=Phenylobacterium sp. TaxID=1871053 RepID=UPI0025F07564|nr:MFS transporter [Phenylobacterium sp.]MBI1198594.1 MFS transporter [Phenylobacterium sp.]
MTDDRGRARLDLGAVSWSLYQGARDPYVNLIVIYVFFPYFATTVVGDPVRGQALVADIATACGVAVALTAPLLGASIDRIGRRKPLLLLVTALMLPLLAGLWFIRPGLHGPGLALASAMLGLQGLLFAYSEVLHNSMLGRAASPRQAPYASGLALSLGNFFSVFMLVFVLWAFALPGKVATPFVPSQPLFGLDPAAHETDRIVGPLVAACFAILAVPLFLFTPDAAPGGTRALAALWQGWTGLKATVRSLKGHTSAAVFLGSRMLYTDGMSALLVFMGVFAAGVMRWGLLELLAYGVLLSVFAVLGGQVGAILDARLGSRRAVQVSILAAACGLVVLLGAGADRILFMSYDPAAHPPLWDGPIYRTLPEAVFLGIGCWNAVFITAQISSSRTFMMRLAPPGQSAAFFGLYALSGTVTTWLGSALVRIFTGLFNSQQAGFVPVAGLLVLGFVGLLFVRHDGREAKGLPGATARPDVLGPRPRTE